MTVLEQREAYAQLEPAWNGALERAGQAPGLSSYIGRSSIYHSASWERLDTLEHGECKGNGPLKGKRKRGADRRPRNTPGQFDEQIKEMLVKGTSYNGVLLKIDTSLSAVRRCARELGIDRSHLRGTAGWAVGKRSTRNKANGGSAGAATGRSCCGRSRT